MDLSQNLQRESAPGEVVVYFADDPAHALQLRQWLPDFELLHARHPVLVVARHTKTYAALASLTLLPRVLPSFRELVALYESGAHKTAIYVNNMDRHVLAWVNVDHLEWLAGWHFGRPLGHAIEVNQRQ